MMLSSNQILTDYINARNNNTNPLIARCVTGLGPTDNDNAALGGWYFNSTEVPSGECNDSTGLQSNGAAISDYVGVIDLLECGAFSTTAEGVYTCTIMNSLMMSQSMRLGVYFTGRSELLKSYTFRHFVVNCFCVQLLQP